MDVPDKIKELDLLCTERLVIRRVEEKDWPSIQAVWIDMSRSFYAQYDRPMDTDDAACRERIARWASFRKSGEHLFFAVLFGGALIGYIVFHQKEEDYETGYCFHSAWHGRGFAKEAMTALLGALAENGITKIIAGTALANTPSVRLLTALGFRLASTEQVSFYEDTSGVPVFFTGGWFECDLGRFAQMTETGERK